MPCFTCTTVHILPSDLSELTTLQNGVNYEVLCYIMFPILLLSLVSYIHNLPAFFFFFFFWSTLRICRTHKQIKVSHPVRKKTSQIVVLRGSSHIWFRLGSKILNRQNAFAGFTCDFHTYYIYIYIYIYCWSHTFSMITNPTDESIQHNI